MNHKIKHKLPRNLRTHAAIRYIWRRKTYASPTTDFEASLSSRYNVIVQEIIQEVVCFVLTS